MPSDSALRRTGTRFAWLVSTLVCAAPVALAAGDEAFLSWASESLQPLVIPDNEESASLHALGEMIGDARIVVLGEGAHGAAQPLVFRNRLFKYLVEEKGFSAIAIESGTVESRVVQEYVLGADGDIDDVTAQGLSWTLDDFPQNKALIDWMRSYNLGQKGERKLTFWGFDVPGSPGNRFAHRGVQTALDEALAYIWKVDEGEARRIEEGIGPLLPLTVFTYGVLPQGDRDFLASTLSRIREVMERRKHQYVAASSQAEYDWAYTSAIGAQQVEAWLRPIPSGWVVEDGFSWSEESLGTRHRAMKDNLDWILKRLSNDERLLIFAALPHVATTELTRSDSERTQVPVGISLKQRFGSRLFTIGNVVSDGQIGNCPRGDLMKLNPPPATSLSHLLGRVGIAEFVLDLRSPPTGVATYLARPHELWNGFATMSLVVGDAFDAVYFSGPLVPACPSGVQ